MHLPVQLHLKGIQFVSSKLFAGQTETQRAPSHLLMQMALSGPSLNVVLLQIQSGNDLKINLARHSIRTISQQDQIIPEFG